MDDDETVWQTTPGDSSLASLMKAQRAGKGAEATSAGREAKARSLAREAKAAALAKAKAKTATAKTATAKANSWMVAKQAKQAAASASSTAAHTATSLRRVTRPTPISVKRENAKADTTAATAADAADLTECSVRAVDPVRIAVLFHGTMGTLQHTLPSIQANLLAPLMGMAHGATLDSFVHLIDTHDLVDPANPENKMPYLPPSEAKLLRQLGTCRFRVAKSSKLDEQYNLSALVNLHAAGSAANANAAASKGTALVASPLGADELRSLYRTRVSLYKAATIVAAYEVQRGFNYTILVAARPDTEFASAVPISMPPRGTVFVPSFAHGTWATGVNDRFAYGDRNTMFATYTSQLDVAESFNNGAARAPAPLRLFDGEQMLCSHLRARSVVVASSNFCLVRTNEAGEREPTDYTATREAPHCTYEIGRASCRERV